MAVEPLHFFEESVDRFGADLERATDADNRCLLLQGTQNGLFLFGRKPTREWSKREGAFAVFAEAALGAGAVHPVANDGFRLLAMRADDDLDFRYHASILPATEGMNTR